MPYPSAIPVLSNPGPGTFMDAAGFEHDVQHANANNEIEFIAGELGINPRGGYASVVARLNDAVQITGVQTVTGAKTFSSVINIGTAAAFVLVGGGPGNHSIELGRQDGVASTPFIDFHGGATAVDYDARIIAGSNGDGTTGGSTLEVDARQFFVLGMRAASVPFVARSAVSATVDIAQFQDNTGAAKASIDLNGGIRAPYFQNPSSAGPYFDLTTTAMLIYNRTSAANTPLLVRGMVAQTGDLQQWQNSTPATVASIRQDGYFKGKGLLTVTDTGPYIDFSTGITVNIINRSDVANVPLKVTALAGQTGDLQQWLNSAGATQSRVKTNGVYVGGSNIVQVASGTAGLGAPDGNGNRAITLPAVYQDGDIIQAYYIDAFTNRNQMQWVYINGSTMYFRNTDVGIVGAGTGTTVYMHMFRIAA